jgi:phospholipid/cholesterol/gamma-HCH transport system permease protein
MIAVLRTIGAGFLEFLASVGRIMLFALSAVSHCFRPPFYFRLIGRQMMDIGYYSLPVVGMTTLFSGMVLALQSYSGFARFSAESAVATVVVLSITRELAPVLAGLMVAGRVGAAMAAEIGTMRVTEQIARFSAESAVATVVVLSITRELAPVLAGLMVAGRVGAAMAAEIGTMRVTEQIDALTTLSTNPFKYLIVPRVLAATLMLPVLVAVGDVIGVFGGYVVGIYKLGFNPAAYIKSTIEYLEFQDVLSGLVKAATFGFLISLMGCYHGFKSRGGAQGVGAATTNAVVSASILILISNYIITELFFAK